MQRVEKTADCWLWTGAMYPSGYGQFRPCRERTRGFGLAHRWSYELFIGPIPEGLVVRHTCDVKRCVNPAHLEIGTQAQNIGDAVAKGRNPIGSSHGNTTVGADTVAAIKAGLAAGERHMNIAKKCGVRRQYVWQIAHGSRARD